MPEFIEGGLYPSGSEYPGPDELLGSYILLASTATLVPLLLDGRLAYTVISAPSPQVSITPGAEGTLILTLP